MGWRNCHLYQFTINGTEYSHPEMWQPEFEEIEDATQIRLRELMPESSEQFQFLYEYDFGDGWRHDILFEGCLFSQEGGRYSLSFRMPAAPSPFVGALHLTKTAVKPQGRAGLRPSKWDTRMATKEVLMTRIEKAKGMFAEGFNCSQSIVAAYASSIGGLDRETALKLASGFGGGMGRLADTCGAVGDVFRAENAEPEEWGNVMAGHAVILKKPDFRPQRQHYIVNALKDGTNWLAIDTEKPRKKKGEDSRPKPMSGVAFAPSTATKNSSRSSDATTSALAVRANDSRSAASSQAAFDGENRDDYF